MNEIERDLHDALAVTKNVIMNPMLLPGGGATEMALSVHLSQESRKLATTTAMAPATSSGPSSSNAYISSLIMAPYGAVGEAVEVIPRTLISNCGGDVIRTMTLLRAKHSENGGHSWGINGITGKLMNMSEEDGPSSTGGGGGVWEPFAVKIQTLKTAIEVCLVFSNRVLVRMHASARGWHSCSIFQKEGRKDLQCPPCRCGGRIAYLISRSNPNFINANKPVDYLPVPIGQTNFINLLSMG